MDAIHERWLALVGVGAAVLVLTLPAQAGREAREASMTFWLASTPTSFRQVDRAPKSVESKGDVLYVKSVLRNARAGQFGHPKGAIVGSDSWVLTVVKPGWSLAKVEVKLRGGTLRLRGQVHASQSRRVVPVVGGTGRFANARGTCEDRQGTTVDTIDVYRLRLP